MITAVSAVK